jgi:dihydroorotase
LPVSCDVGAHHVHLTDVDIGYFDSNARVTPPFRAQRDRDAIRQGLLDGTIDAICSDHTPVDDDEKLLPFGEASPGATGLELLLPLALKWAEDADQPLSRAVARITADAARIVGLPCGQLGVGSSADLCLFDPAARWTVKANALASQGKHTPFLGYELRGQVKATIVAGHLAFQR